MNAQIDIEFNSGAQLPMNANAVGMARTRFPCSESLSYGSFI